METAENASETLKIARNRSKSLEIARNRSNLASADVTLRLRLGFWPVKSGQCYNVLPIVSVVGPNYQFQLLPTLSSMFSGILSRSPRHCPRRLPSRRHRRPCRRGLSCPRWSTPRLGTAATAATVQFQRSPVATAVTTAAAATPAAIFAAIADAAERGGV